MLWVVIFPRCVSVITLPAFFRSGLETERVFFFFIVVLFCKTEVLVPLKKKKKNYGSNWKCPVKGTDEEKHTISFAESSLLNHIQKEQEFLVPIFTPRASLSSWKSSRTKLCEIFTGKESVLKVTQWVWGLGKEPVSLAVWHRVQVNGQKISTTCQGNNNIVKCFKCVRLQ